MIVDEECPLDIVEEALELASQIEVGDIPSDFDPGDLSWKGILASIAQQFSNHPSLLDQLEDLVAEAKLELCPDCDPMVGGSDGEGCAACSERWLAEYWLREAALAAAERAYQRWLARQALRRAANRDA